MKYFDLLLTNGNIYTVDDKNSVVKSMGIIDEKIVFVGNDYEAKELIGDNTRVIDLDGKMVLPGFIDSHIHPPGTALTELYEVSLYGINTLEEVLTKVEKFINDNPDMELIFGRGWSLGLFSGEELGKGPKKDHLDKISKDKPIMLRAYDGHTMWLNSKAFELFNITKDTIPPEGGKIELDGTGDLWGSLKESAIHLTDEVEYSEKQLLKAFEHFQKMMHSYGVTSMLSLSGLKWGIQCETYEELIKKDKLKMRVTGSIMIDPKEDIDTQLQMIKERRERFKFENFKITNIKLLTDGVVEGTTAFLNEPYSTYAGKGEGYSGEPLWDQERLEEVIYKINKNDFSIHVHSVGDGATKMTLDAIEVANNKLNNKNYRNALTHLQLVAKEDIKRFKTLNVIAAVQPYWHIKGPGWWENVDYKLLGKRAEVEYPLKSFLDEGVLIASSSDHSVTPVPNPLYAIEAGVTRNLYNPEYFGVEDIEDMDDERYLLNKNERVSVEDMIRSFTINGAYSIYREDEIGSLEVGKYADFIILDKNILEIDPINIEKAEVLMTFIGGQLVYKNK